ncbi:hypothetical protein MTR67_034684 [Solanum verrucosum]|uniref:Uncharacterized protein n=1 Tax=Solanum verrucosum TaxID=315347 RepID=A0AAF0ZLJ7_SOLVR|nr:hypothetical protein MTR67_034684 [Solanum verrucosum]
MHIEKNFFENVFNTVLDVDGKTKDNPKSIEDLKDFCRRPELHVVDGKYPKAIYTLKEESKKLFSEWVKSLKFPVGCLKYGKVCGHDKTQVIWDVTSTVIHEEDMARVHIDNQFIKALAEGPCRSAKPYTGYNVNVFKFHTKGRSFLEHLITVVFA